MINLSRKQAKQFADIVDKFPEVEFFTIEEIKSSGIGSSTIVRFDLFNNLDDQVDTTVNITDVDQW